MKTKTSDSWSEFVSTTAAGYVLAAGLLTMLGWVLDRPRLTDWINSGISAFPNAAICAILSVIALRGLVPKPAWVSQNITRIFASIVTLLGSLTLLEHLFGLNFGIDTLLF